MSINISSTIFRLLCLLVFPLSAIGQNVTNLSYYSTVGAEFSTDKILGPDELQLKLESFKTGDSLQVVFKSTVSSVCQQKGCWMNLEFSEAEEVMVKFKDYAFFVPKNIAQKKVIVKGKVYVTELSVDEQRHYAMDAGKSSEEVNSITKPGRQLSFLAEGVKIKE